MALELERGGKRVGDEEGGEVELVRDGVGEMDEG